MGTHNRVLKLGESAYLEVIAADPAVPAHGRRRWFQLDEPGHGDAPRLATWVVRTNDIHAAVDACPLRLGSVETMTRGALEWLITVPQDGRLVLDGVAPVLIQWPEGVHPTHSLADRGCRLLALEALHPAAVEVNRFLAAIGFAGPFRAQPLSTTAKPHLAARIETPGGTRELGGAWNR